MKPYIKKKETVVEKERRILWKAEHVLEKTKAEERRAAALLM